MDYLLKAVGALLSVALVSFAQTKADIVIFDEDDPVGDGFYDASWGYVTPPSTLTLAGASGDKLKIETTQHVSGSQSIFLQSNHGTRYTLPIFFVSLNFAGRDARGY